MLRSPAAMIELVAAGAALASRALLQAADAAVLAAAWLAAARPRRWSLARAGPTYLVCAISKPPMRLMLRIFDALLLRQGATARYTPPPPPLEQIERILSGEARAGEKPGPSAE